ncbi:MAG: C39 family peptidase [Gammaproteobacteria bacterium]|nr:C39 family peptidase [Gammaproteobacteria bacterium]
MLASYRHGDRASAAKYPLATAAALPWQAAADGAWCELALPPCPAAHIIVPSLSADLSDCAYRVTLRSADERWTLQAVPSSPPSAGCHARRRPASVPVSTHIDCFHTEANLPASRLRFTLGQAEPPLRHLLAVSVRPLVMDPKLPDAARAVAPQPPAISQMLGPQAIARRICSPTALAMALKAADAGIDWLEVVERCFDQRTQSYGCWPMAIRCAAAFGRLGAVEALPAWEPAIQVLRSGLPIVASIDFAAGELPGAPLSRTAGHLVTCYGVDGDAVLVNDPAAGDAADVPRRYGLEAFSQAWLRRRGAAYIMPAP